MGLQSEFDASFALPWTGEYFVIGMSDASKGDMRERSMYPVISSVGRIRRLLAMLVSFQDLQVSQGLLLLFDLWHRTGWLPGSF